MVEYKIDLIKKYLEEQNLSKEEFCQKIDISVEDLDKILNNEVDISVLTLFNVANGMGLDLIDIIVDPK